MILKNGNQFVISKKNKKVVGRSGRLLPLLLLFMGLFMALPKAKGQIDSLYIGDFDYKFSLSTYLLKDYIRLSQQFDSGDKISLYPNNPVSLGVGIAIKNTVIDISYGYALKFLQDSKYGKTSAFDLQLHNYGRKYVLDIFIQRYQGFYQDKTKKTNSITLFPDVKVRQYGVWGQYVFNHRRFSYKAAFVQDERQLRSAGSFLVGGSVFKTRVRSDGSYTIDRSQYFRRLQFGINAGYAYSYVINKYLYLGGSLSFGVNFGSQNIRSFKINTDVYPSILYRFSAGYNRSSWSLGITYVSNMLYPSLSKEQNVRVTSGGLQFTFIRRFTRFPFTKKKK